MAEFHNRVVDDEPLTEKRKFSIDFELDPKVNDTPNKFKLIIDLAKAIDSWRIFPRVFISVYIYLLYDTVTWFMALESPTVEQAGLISVMTGVGAAWFASYTKTKGDAD